eukprot:Gb_00504 [translate_table: standard]
MAGRASLAYSLALIDFVLLCPCGGFLAPGFSVLHISSTGASFFEFFLLRSRLSEVPLLLDFCQALGVAGADITASHTTVSTLLFIEGLYSDSEMVSLFLGIIDIMGLCLENSPMWGSLLRIHFCHRLSSNCVACLGDGSMAVTVGLKHPLGAPSRFRCWLSDMVFGLSGFLVNVYRCPVVLHQIIRDVRHLHLVYKSLWITRKLSKKEVVCSLVGGNFASPVEGVRSLIKVFKESLVKGCLLFCRRWSQTVGEFCCLSEVALSVVGPSEVVRAQLLPCQRPLLSEVVCSPVGGDSSFSIAFAIGQRLHCR